MGIVSLRDDGLRIAVVLRVIAAVHLGYGVYYEFYCVHPPPDQKKYATGGKFKYMTNWNLVRDIDLFFNYILIRLWNINRAIFTQFGTHVSLL